MATEHQINTSQDVVRALRAPADPPYPGSPSKIEIARNAWDNGSLNFPQKRELLLEYALSRLLKDKNAEEYATSISSEWLTSLRRKSAL